MNKNVYTQQNEGYYYLFWQLLFIVSQKVSYREVSHMLVLQHVALEMIRKTATEQHFLYSRCLPLYYNKPFILISQDKSYIN